jgi:hypothetical protein
MTLFTSDSHIIHFQWPWHYSLLVTSKQLHILKALILILFYTSRHLATFNPLKFSISALCVRFCHIITLQDGKQNNCTLQTAQLYTTNSTTVHYKQHNCTLKTAQLYTKNKCIVLHITSILQIINILYNRDDTPF